MIIPTTQFIGGNFTCYDRGGSVAAEGHTRAGGTFIKFLSKLHLPPGFVPEAGSAIVAAFNRAKAPPEK
jgi:hypothetical protein